MTEIEEFVKQQLEKWARRLPRDKRKEYRIVLLTEGRSIMLTIDDVIKELENRTDIGKKYCEMIMAGIKEMFGW